MFAERGGRGSRRAAFFERAPARQEPRPPRIASHAIALGWLRAALATPSTPAIKSETIGNMSRGRLFLLVLLALVAAGATGVAWRRARAPAAPVPRANDTADANATCCLAPPVARVLDPVVNASSQPSGGAATNG